MYFIFGQLIFMVVNRMKNENSKIPTYDKMIRCSDQAVNTVVSMREELYQDCDRKFIYNFIAHVNRQSRWSNCVSNNPDDSYEISDAVLNVNDIMNQIHINTAKGLLTIEQYFCHRYTPNPQFIELNRSMFRLISNEKITNTIRNTLSSSNPDYCVVRERIIMENRIIDFYHQMSREDFDRIPNDMKE